MTESKNFGGPALAVARFVQRTGMHAVPSIATERTKVSRIGWTLLLAIAVILLVFQVTKIAVKLRSYPTSTDTTISYESPIPFPAVTMCNLNPMLYDQLLKMRSEETRRRRNRRAATKSPLSEIWDLINVKEEEETFLEEDVSDNTEELVEIYLENSTAQVKEIRTKKDDYVVPTEKGRRADFVKKDLVMMKMNSIENEDLKKLTYSLDAVVIDCSFQGKHCDFERDFVRIMNPRYGACYIFNSGLNASIAPVKTITNSGTDNGLELILFVDEDSYLPGIAPDVGFKLLVHDQTSPPMPDRDGFMLRPGVFTMLGLRATEIERAEEPYGKCKHFSKEENERRNMFVDILPMTSPTMTTCMRTCEQSEILYHCGCYSLQHGYSSAPAFNQFNDSVRRRACDLNDKSKDYKCVTNTLNLETQKSSYCKRNLCTHHECISRRFTVSQSASGWPSKKSYDILKKSWSRKSASLSSIKENYVKVLVYFEDLNVIRIKTQPSYQFVDFLSDLGGQGGLWLGISAFTAIEFLVLLGELSHLTARHFVGKPAKLEEGGKVLDKNPKAIEDVSLKKRVPESISSSKDENDRCV